MPLILNIVPVLHPWYVTYFYLYDVRLLTLHWELVSWGHFLLREHVQRGELLLITICMGVFSRYYHLFNQNFTGRRNTNRAHVVLSRFIVLAARHPYFSVPTCPFPDLVLDVIRAGCRPAPRRGRCRPHSHSGWTCYCADWRGLIVFDASHHSWVRLTLF